MSELKTDAVTKAQVMQELANKFGPVNALAQYQECMSSTSRTALVMSQVAKAPSDMQLAISAYIALRFVVTLRQIWMLPSGSGKSRIIPSVGVYLLSCGLAQRVHVLIPGMGLCRRDRTEYADYWELAGFKHLVEYHSTPGFVGKPGRGSGGRSRLPGFH